MNLEKRTDEKGFKPNLPLWFQLNYREVYFRVLREEGNKLGFEIPSGIKSFQEVIPYLTKKLQRRVLRRMLLEYLPRRRVFLHRGSFKGPKFGVKFFRVLGRINPFLEFIPYWFLKNPAYDLNELQRNLMLGIGGIEIDVVMNEKGNPVVCHPSFIMRKPKTEVFLEEFFLMIRSILPSNFSRFRLARRNLKVILDVKMTSDFRYRQNKFAEQIISLIRRFSLEKNIIIQAYQPDILYYFDEVEARPKNGLPYILQVFPLGNQFWFIKFLLKNLRFIESYNQGEIICLSRQKLNSGVIMEFPPKGEIIEVLKRHQGVIHLSSLVYKKEMLAAVKKLGLELYIGGLLASERIEEFLAADSLGNRPLGILALEKKAIFPKSDFKL